MLNYERGDLILLRTKCLILTNILNVILLGILVAICFGTVDKPVKNVKSSTVTTRAEIKLRTVKLNKKKHKKSKWKSLGVFKCTAYCSCPKCCGIYSNNRTATGTIPVENRTIAVDPNIIPYGTKVLINKNIYIAEDCGGMIKGSHIDIFYSSHSRALNKGTKYMEVKVRNK